MSMKWDEWVESALCKLESLKLLRSLRPINVSNNFHAHEYQVFDNLRQWDRTSVEVMISDSTFHHWLNDIPSCGSIEVPKGEEANDGQSCSRSGRKLLLFSGNDYLGLSAHPCIREIVAKVVQQHGMGPRGSALICGYTDYHAHLEACLADLKKKEDCLLCPTGFAANMAFMVAVGSIASLLASSKIPIKPKKLPSSLMPLIMHQSLMASALAHGTFICGKNGGGVAQEFNCESDVDICIGTLSKAAGCTGAAAAFVAGKEAWRRRAIQERVQDFRNLTGIPITSHIVSIIVGSEEKSLLASRYMLKSGFHVTAIRPPTVPPNSCRLRITLSAAHTRNDVKKLAAALSRCISFKDLHLESSGLLAKL
ncbi:8-amino-7-oxononanoate synthase [Bienertia sinuspersici]